ncbi:MAG: DUF5301 domain-containing protein, partial [Clostridia bacterium]
LQIWIFLGRVLWLSGIAALLIYSVVSLLKLRRRLKDAVQESGNIYTSASLTSPFVMGLFRPKIYLPAHLTEEEKSYIVLHEQTHIKRLDHVVKIVSFFVLCLHWFNPLVWVAFFLCGRDMELSCDEAVIKKLGSDVKKDYSSSLLSLATGRRIVGGTPLAFGEGDTKSRIKNVLNYKKPAFWMIVVSVIAIVAVGIGLAANPKNNPILIPKSDEIASIRIEQINEGESLGVVEIVDKNQIETILKALQNTNKTMQESVNDTPNRNDYFQININGSDSKKFYLYSNREQYFIEEPYAGIYKTSRETSVSIAKIYTAAPSDYKPAIMINDQIYWLSTDANPDAPSGNTWLLGQIKKVSPQSAPPSENFEAIGLDFSYVGKDIYISPDGKTLYLDSIAGEKTLQFVFDETKTDITEPVSTAYIIMKLGKNGEVLAEGTAENQELAQKIVMDGLVKSAAWEGVDVGTLEECYLIRQSFAEANEIHDYYAYRLADGTSVLQSGTDGRYSAISSDLYLQLVDSFNS